LHGRRTIRGVVGAHDLGDGSDGSDGSDAAGIIDACRTVVGGIGIPDPADLRGIGIGAARRIDTAGGRCEAD
jgi:hypothetical protein